MNTDTFATKQKEKNGSKRCEHRNMCNNKKIKIKIKIVNTDICAAE